MTTSTGPIDSPAAPSAVSVEHARVHLGLPKGRMQERLFSLLADAGIEVRVSSRGYRPRVSLPGLDAKILKPQNIVEMLQAGSRDVGFAGADWVAELRDESAPELVELLDTELDPVRIVAAAPPALLREGRLPASHPSGRPWVIVSEMERLTRAWIASAGLNARFVRSYGATEVFPPEDADAIVDITQTGATLEANNLSIFYDLLASSTRMYANARSLEDPAKRDTIERMVLNLKSVLDARGRVMLELNVPDAQLAAVVDALPCLREPTVARLHRDEGYAVKAAVPRREVATLVPELKSRGGTDIVISPISRVVL